jgi:hypothetical protein
VEVKNWVTQVTTEHQLGLQQQIINFLLKAYGGLLTAAMAIFFLQGFQLGGFHLDPELLKWLGGTTVGAVAGLLTLTFGAVFKRGKRDSISPHAIGTRRFAPTSSRPMRCRGGTSLCCHAAASPCRSC